MSMISSLSGISSAKSETTSVQVYEALASQVIKYMVTDKAPGSNNKKSLPEA